MTLISNASDLSKGRAGRTKHPSCFFPTMFQLHGYHCATGTDAGEACCENRWTGVVLQLPWDFTIENPIVWINRQVEHGDREPNVSSQAKRARTNS